MKQEQFLETFVNSVNGLQELGGKIIGQYGEPHGDNFYKIGLIIKRKELK